MHRRTPFPTARGAALAFLEIAVGVRRTHPDKIGGEAAMLVDPLPDVARIGPPQRRSGGLELGKVKAETRLGHDADPAARNMAQQDRASRLARSNDAYVHAARGVNVRIVGPCQSACTVLLGHIPRSRTCVTPAASFGFHLAKLPAATATLWGAYQGDIRGWIDQHGGLTGQFIWMRAPDTYRYFKKC